MSARGEIDERVLVEWVKQIADNPDGGFSERAALDLISAHRGALVRIKALEAQLTPGSLTERAPTTWAYEQACLALEKHRNRANALETLLGSAHAELEGVVRKLRHEKRIVEAAHLERRIELIRAALSATDAQPQAMPTPIDMAKSTAVQRLRALIGKDIEAEAAEFARAPLLMITPGAELQDTEIDHVIVLSPAEIQSGLDRVRWAELLIRQLPDTHDGRNSWLLNYGTRAST